MAKSSYTHQRCYLRCWNYAEIPLFKTFTIPEMFKQGIISFAETKILYDQRKLQKDSSRYSFLYHSVFPFLT